jgi:hypothetical protein
MGGVSTLFYSWANYEDNFSEFGVIIVGICGITAYIIAYIKLFTKAG